MCGRFSQNIGQDLLRRRFNTTDDIPEINYNIAPTQPAYIVTGSEEKNIVVMKWGLIPFWAKDEEFGLKTFNSRSETIGEKKAFAYSFKNKRCVIPMSGFYEWKKTADRKIPFYIHLKDDILAVAGIFDHWKNPSGQIIKSFSIVTTKASDFIDPIHNRMPVILRQDQIDIWNTKETTPDELQACFTPYQDPDLKAYQVSSLVNHSKHNQPEVIRPLFTNDNGEPIYYDPETQDIEPQKSLEDFF